MTIEDNEMREDKKMEMKDKLKNRGGLKVALLSTLTLIAVAALTVSIIVVADVVTDDDDDSSVYDREDRKEEKAEYFEPDKIHHTDALDGLLVTSFSNLLFPGNYEDEETKDCIVKSADEVLNINANSGDLKITTITDQEGSTSTVTDGSNSVVLTRELIQDYRSKVVECVYEEHTKDEDRNCIRNWCSWRWGDGWHWDKDHGPGRHFDDDYSDDYSDDNKRDNRRSNNANLAKKGI